MDNIVIETENNTKFLDVLMDDNLLWKQHINDVSTKIQKSIGILYKSREIHLNYASISWASTYKSKLEGIRRTLSPSETCSTYNQF